jgi:virulence factor Mce-like protein
VTGVAKAKERHELTRSDLAKRGLIVVLGVTLVLGLLFLRSNGTFGGPVHLSAQLADAGGSLGSGADVKVRGVIVGKVTGIEHGPSGSVQVNLTVPAGKLNMIPQNVVARILPATVFGTSFVDLTTHGAVSTHALVAGEVIPADATQGTLELQQALDDIDSLVKAVGPAELASALGSAAQALKGRGKELGDSIDLADEYLGKLNPKLPLAREDLHKLVANIQLAEQVAPDLLQATNDALTTARTIVEEQASLTSVITGGTALTDQANAFLSANQAGLIRFIQNSAVLLNVVYANRHAGITEALLTNRMVNAKLSTVVSHGFIHASTSFLLAWPPYYTAADCSGISRASVGAMLGGGAP